MHFKNARSTGKGTYTCKGTTLKVMVSIGPKLVFDQMAAPVPEIMDGSLYVEHLWNSKMLWKNLSMNAVHIFRVLFISDVKFFKREPYFERFCIIKYYSYYPSVFFFVIKIVLCVHLWVRTCINYSHQGLQSHALVWEFIFSTDEKRCTFL
jgi:hypothetical protein